MRDRISLAYVGVRGDFAAWRAFAGDLHGMQEETRSGALRFRMDERAWRLEVDSEGPAGFAFAGFEWNSVEGYEAALARLRAAGKDVAEDPRLAAHRQVARVARFEGLGGIPFEFCLGHGVVAVPFVSPTGARFVTGAAGMGHIGIRVADQPAADRFLLDVMGLRTTVWASHGPHFMHGGPRHHVVVTVPTSPGAPEGLHHFFVEVDDIPTVGRAWDRVSKGEAKVVRTIGQHSNDPALSYYCEGPSGVVMEFGWNSQLIDEDAWVPSYWVGDDYWGHHPPEGE